MVAPHSPNLDHNLPSSAVPSSAKMENGGLLCSVQDVSVLVVVTSEGLMFVHIIHSLNNTRITQKAHQLFLGCDSFISFRVGSGSCFAMQAMATGLPRLLFISLLRLPHLEQGPQLSEVFCTAEFGVTWQSTEFCWSRFMESLGPCWSVVDVWGSGTWSDTADEFSAWRHSQAKWSICRQPVWQNYHCFSHQ